VLRSIGLTLQRVLGGSSGPLYGVLFLRAASTLEKRPELDMNAWGDACTEACAAVSELGGAIPGDCTMLDALLPFAETLKKAGVEGQDCANALKRAVVAVQTGAARTANMIPKRGRSSYLGERAVGHPDPGAVAVSIWLEATVAAVVSES